MDDPTTPAAAPEDVAGAATPAVEREIYVTADLEAVWELVSRPGWWINDGEVDDHPVLRTEDDVTVLTHPEWGDFAIRTVTSERPHRVAFRWTSGPSPEVGEASTLVELRLEQRPGGVTLSVVESGFDELTDDPDEAAEVRTQNDEGWSNELRAARDFVLAHA